MTVDLPPFADFYDLEGISIATAAAGIAKQGRDDIALFELAPGSTCAAVFTTNAFAAAPVNIARKHLRSQPRYWLVNSGNANAANGDQGYNDALYCCNLLAESAHVSAEQILPFSTGVIGQRLPLKAFEHAIPNALKKRSSKHWDKAARAIMTTDTVPKGVSIKAPFADLKFTLNGIVKGSGMIHPNMATMLAFLATDLKASNALLQESIEKAVSSSFHHITVDGDTSTNDAVIIAATGKSDLPSLDDNAELLNVFQEQLNYACKSLAEAVIRDAEGANKFITINVLGAKSQKQADTIAKTIALSPLVKTALFAGDPNWGRIICAIGYAGIEGLNPNQVHLSVNGVSIVNSGKVANSYSEELGLKAFSHHDIEINVDIGMGDASGYCLTCDLGHDYVTINAEYRS